MMLSCQYAVVIYGHVGEHINAKHFMRTFFSARRRRRDCSQNLVLAHKLQQVGMSCRSAKSGNLWNHGNLVAILVQKATEAVLL